eukprot:TRINITY_DN22194_c0_g1_i1.p1 TRINITY_DN22194_c0_g1~~TRINITY_DN22194_c0_g1_i1.p1  ORF type:complete len:135 (+),score=14.59 TRINITY_DN22194_c0_g1_i1:35-439(+)
MDPAVLEETVESLRALLPGVDVTKLVYQDRSLLTVQFQRAADRLVLLSRELGGCDLTQLIVTAPQLLYAEDVEERLTSTLAHFRRLLPAPYPRAAVQQLLTQAPTLIFRMELYENATELSDLPTDVVQDLRSLL